MNTMISNKNESIIRKGNPLCLGLFPDDEGFYFAVNLDTKKSCGLLLWKKEEVISNSYEISTNTAKKIIFTDDYRIGNNFSGVVSGIIIAEYVYCYFCDDLLISDIYGRGFIEPCMCEISEKKEKISIVLAYTINQKFNWGTYVPKTIPFENSIIYGIHVKGFTKHSSSQVVCKGTYKGIIEKLDYLKKLKITTLELMPSYEFVSNEILNEEDRQSAYSYKEEVPSSKDDLKRTNYWGYKNGLYFSPKASYSTSSNPQYEMKELVKTMHENKMEIIMQFFFPDYYDVQTILDVLRFWVMEYHVDGFRLIGGRIPKEYLAYDGILAKSKLIFDSLNEMEERNLKHSLIQDHIATFDANYFQDVRKFLKGDEDKIQPFIQHMFQHANFGATIHAITDYVGFTLNDLVSYDRKHNEENGENNKDGTNFNYSWNCGEEGPTKKRKINSLRKKQMKNAFCMLLLSQATPYIRGGDEFAFSQQGNNNPYCQDNEISWLDWSLIKKNKDQVTFVKDLIQFRLEHPILHMKKRLRVMDYLGCGYPDVSFHGEEAWRPVLDNVSRHVGIMYCGKYANRNNTKEDDFIYLTYNLHWAEHKFALPRLPDDKIWDKVFETQVRVKNENRLIKEKVEKNIENELVSVEARSICVFKSKER